MRAIVLLAVALAACAQPPAQMPLPVQPPPDSVVPGSIGVTVRQESLNVIVAAVGKNGAASGVRVGDVVVRYNGEAVSSPRQFYRLVVDSAPGSLARLEVIREGALRLFEVPVRELDLMLRV
jgi:S1-C subfamily serine protease